MNCAFDIHCVSPYLSLSCILLPYTVSNHVTRVLREILSIIEPPGFSEYSVTGIKNVCIYFNLVAFIYSPLLSIVLTCVSIIQLITVIWFSEHLLRN